MACTEQRGIKRNILEQSVEKDAQGGSVGIPQIVDVTAAAEQVTATLSHVQTEPTENDLEIIRGCKETVASAPSPTPNAGGQTASPRQQAAAYRAEGQVTNVGDLSIELQWCAREGNGDVRCTFALAGENDLSVGVGVGGSEMMGGCAPSEARDEEGNVLRPIMGELPASKAGHCIGYNLVPGTRPKLTLVFPEVSSSVTKLVHMAVAAYVTRTRTGQGEHGKAVFRDVAVQ